MDTVTQLQRQYVDFLSSLYREGHLDDQFSVLQSFQDPAFLKDAANDFFRESDKLLHDLANALSGEEQQVDYKKVAGMVHKFKGSTSCIGAQRVSNKCVDFKAYYDAKQLGGCLTCFQQVRDEYDLVKSKIQTLLKMEEEIIAAGGSVPMMGEMK